MKIVFMGSAAFSLPSLDRLAAEHQILAVYCQPPRPAGRGKADRPTPVHARALDLGLPVRHPVSLRTPEALADFDALGAEAAVVVAYGLLLPPPVLATPPLGCLNIHASLLPRWRGAAPIHRAIMAGDSETGVCIMQMDKGLDTGPVLARRALPIQEGETTGDLHDRLAGLGADLVADVLRRLPLPATPQPATGITYAQKIDKAEARIDWTWPATEVERRIRGLSPFPGAWCMIRGERVKLLRARLAAGSGRPGQLIGAMTVACGTGAVEITLAQREGRKSLPPAELVKGWSLPEALD